AEMGTYGRGEIAELCSWMAPDVAVITAVGPVHLERFGSEEKIVQAKAEILADARCCVLVVDDQRIADLANACEAAGKRLWRVTTGSPDPERGGTEVSHPSISEPTVDVSVVKHPDGLEVRARGEELVNRVAVPAQPGNVACAVAVALELGVPAGEIATRLGSLPVAPHRLESQVAPGGFVVLDDTYNANPAGVRVALAALAEAARDGGRRVVATPGMVELGPCQEEENARFATEAARVSSDLVVVGRTNRRALVRGFGQAVRRGSGGPIVVGRREQAVTWVREHLGPGDAVLYENDLPDHYP
ncbi:MAG: Mur ligase family protein, partial [Acidimicrobiales bacterium]